MESVKMYRAEDERQLELVEFTLPFEGKLDPENRWVIMAHALPWEEIEKRYAHVFSEDNGAPAKSVRMAFGSLLIKEYLGLTDRETVEQIRENPYLQYFLGLKEYSKEAPFHHSLMTYFRKRLSAETLFEINETMVKQARKKQQEREEGKRAKKQSPPDDKDKQPPSNQGKLLVDATCTPADIAYPTDLKLLNEAREKTEAIIDEMHEPFVGKEAKPRTYREKARRQYLAVAKQKRAGAKKIRRAIRQQLQYVERNLKTIDDMTAKGRLVYVSKRLQRLLPVIRELVKQQRFMYESGTHRVPDRIVSLYQPHVRPIVRGKAKNETEFGAKVSISLVDGYSYVERIGWDAYNESCDLIKQIEDYKKRFGFYPESVHVDQIYRSQENRRFCRTNGIRLSGAPLGRPKQDGGEAKRQWRQDERDRCPIEGKFGQGKRRFTLGRIMARLKQTAETVISVSFLVMNLEKVRAWILSFLFFVLKGVFQRRFSAHCRLLRAFDATLATAA